MQPHEQSLILLSRIFPQFLSRQSILLVVRRSPRRSKISSNKHLRSSSPNDVKGRFWNSFCTSASGKKSRRTALRTPYRPGSQATSRTETFSLIGLILCRYTLNLFRKPQGSGLIIYHGLSQSVNIHHIHHIHHRHRRSQCVSGQQMQSPLFGCSSSEAFRQVYIPMRLFLLSLIDQAMQSLQFQQQISPGWPSSCLRRSAGLSVPS